MEYCFHNYFNEKWFCSNNMLLELCELCAFLDHLEIFNWVFSPFFMKTQFFSQFYWFGFFTGMISTCVVPVFINNQELWCVTMATLGNFNHAFLIKLSILFYYFILSNFLCLVMPKYNSGNYCNNTHSIQYI